MSVCLSVGLITVLPQGTGLMEDGCHHNYHYIGCHYDYNFFLSIYEFSLLRLINSPSLLVEIVPIFVLRVVS